MYKQFFFSEKKIHGTLKFLTSGTYESTLLFIVSCKVLYPPLFLFVCFLIYWGDIQMYNSIIQRLYIALCADCPKFRLLLSPHIWSLLPSSTSPHHTFPLVPIIPLSVSMFLFVHLSLSVLYFTDEWNHVVLVLTFNACQGGLSIYKKHWVQES